MKRALIEKKKKLLKRISIEEYWELLSFIEKIYLSDYDLKILLARKSSNLYLSLIDLVCEENGGRVRQIYQGKYGDGKKEPVIISDRALEYLHDEIVKGTYKNILIVDDIIVRGRTVLGLKNQIKGWFSGLPKDKCPNIRTLVFSQNEEGSKQIWKQNDEEDENEDVINMIKKQQVHEWRSLADKIVDIFYMLNQPYTSYIPNIILKLNEEQEKQFQKYIKDNALYNLNGETDNTFMNLSAYADISDENIGDFALFQSVRIYHSSDSKQYLLVPMISFRPFDEDTLKQYLIVLKPLMKQEFWNKIKNISNEFLYRVVIYILSAVWGRYFLLKTDIPNLTLSITLAEEEKMNFGTQILDQEVLEGYSISEIRNCFEKMSQKYTQLPNEQLSNIHPDFGKFEKCLLSFNSEDNCKADIVVGRFLYYSNKIEDGSLSKRMDGYPVTLLAEHMKSKKNNLKTCFNGILKAIDFGKGSIVAKEYSYNNKLYYVSVLRAGEQNYKYLEENYFPFLYGLLQIEKFKLGDECKQNYVEGYKKVWIQKGKYCNEEDLKELVKINITKDYKSLLIRDAGYYSEDAELRKAVDLARSYI